MNDPISYRAAGVDVERADATIPRLAAAARRTHGPGVVSGLGGFGGLFALKDALGELSDPVLVSGTDGVGTKLLLAQSAGRHEGIGQDLVAMCVNDVLCTGAKPLFFLDYYATSRLDPEHLVVVVEGVAGACASVGCALLGGETAEMPGLYQPGDYDLAGFCVGVVERSGIVDGSSARPGQAIVGLASSGVHSNGFSLARKVVDERLKLAPHDVWIDGATVAELLLAPTRLYVEPVLGLIDAGVRIHAMAHITGGGLPGNLLRPLPKGLGADLDPTSWEEPAVFGALRAGGPIEEVEMRRTFNLGVGFCLVVDNDAADDVVAQLTASGQVAWVIGQTTSSHDEVRFAGSPK